VAKKYQVPILGGLRKVIQPGSTTTAGTTIAELGTSTVTLAQLAQLLNAATATPNTISSSPTAALLLGPGLQGGGPLVGAVRINLTAPPALLPVEGDYSDEPMLPAQGVQGLQGVAGVPGTSIYVLPEDGEPGDPGIGITGPAGTPGAQGVPGAPGTAIYLLAEDGEPGDPGIGVTGPAGAAGAPGVPGAPGTPIYLLPEDGEPGDPGIGITGPSGAAGAAGAAGAPGATLFLLPEDGEPGEFTLGLPGAAGVPGATGAQGPIGSTMYLLPEDGEPGEPGLFLVQPPGSGGSYSAGAGIAISGTTISVNQAYQFNWTNQHFWTFTSGGTTPGITGPSTMSVQCGANTTAAIFVANQGSIPAGESFGVGIVAGTNASDWALWVENGAAGETFMKLNGDGSGQLGYNGASATMTWTSTGNVVFTSDAATNNGAVMIDPVSGQYGMVINGGSFAGLSFVATGFTFGSTDIFFFQNSGTGDGYFGARSTNNVHFQCNSLDVIELSSAAVGFFGTTPHAKQTGYGTPTALSLTTNFPGTGATLAQCGGMLSELITLLKNYGLVGA